MLARFSFLACALLAMSGAHAMDFKNLADNAVVYDGASRQAVPQFILLRGTPVEVVIAVDKWTKVRDVSGGMGWVERSQLNDSHQVIVTAPNTVVRQQPDEGSPAVFTAGKDVLLDPQEKPIKAWVKVKHRDGQTGYIPLKAIWGI